MHVWFFFPISMFIFLRRICRSVALCIHMRVSSLFKHKSSIMRECMKACCVTWRTMRQICVKFQSWLQDDECVCTKGFFMNVMRQEVQLCKEKRRRKDRIQSERRNFICLEIVNNLPNGEFSCGWKYIKTDIESVWVLFDHWSLYTYQKISFVYA